MRVDDPSALPLPSIAANPNDQVIGVDFSGGMASVVTSSTPRSATQLQFSNPSGTTLQVLDDGAGTDDVNALSATTTATSLAAGSAADAVVRRRQPRPITGAIPARDRRTPGSPARIAVNPALLANPSSLVAYQPATAAGDPTRPNFLFEQLTNASLTFSPPTGIGTAIAPFSGTLANYMQPGDRASRAQAASAATNLSRARTSSSARCSSA